MKENHVPSIIKLSILLVLLNFTCLDTSSQINKRVKYSKFQESLAFAVDSVRIPPVLLHENKLIITSGNKLVSMSIYTDTLFRVFQLPGLEYLGGFGRIGNGPEEYLNPSISSLHNYKSELIIQDMRYIRKIQLQEGVVSNNTIRIVDQKKTPSALRMINNFRFINDSMSLGLKLSNAEKQLFVSNMKTDKCFWWIDFPMFYKNIPVPLLGNLYYKKVEVSHSRNRIVFAFHKFPMIQIYDLNGKLIRSTYIDEGPKQITLRLKGGQIDYLGSYLYYDRLYTTEDYIYALFNVMEVGTKEILHGNTKQLHIFDWEGNPVARINVSEELNLFAVDKNNSDFYFVKSNVEDFIYKATIKN